jgi:hypothetical protein
MEPWVPGLQLLLESIGSARTRRTEPESAVTNLAAAANRQSRRVLGVFMAGWMLSTISTRTIAVERAMYSNAPASALAAASSLLDPTTTEKTTWFDGFGANL